MLALAMYAYKELHTTESEHCVQNLEIASRFTYTTRVWTVLVTQAGSIQMMSLSHGFAHPISLRHMGWSSRDDRVDTWRPYTAIPTPHAKATPLKFMG